MKNKILKTVKKYNLLSYGESVLIALSGGADSVLLTRFLLAIRDEFGLKLKAAHVEHGIRGNESMRDCEFCREHCMKNGIELKILHINAPKEAEEAGMGVEEYSRKKRYEFFETFGCDKIATAHNLSDNVETMLFRIARGTSLKGLCSIPPKRENIIRPLIEVTSAEIREYLDSNSINYCVDSTNSDNAYSRNFIRNVLIPHFSKLNPEFQANAAKLIESVTLDEAFLESHIDSIYLSVCRNNRLDVDRLSKLSESEKRRICAKWLSENSFPVNQVNITGICGLIERNSRFKLNGDVYAVSAAGTIRLADLGKKTNDFAFKVVKKTISVKEFLNKCEFNNKKFDFYCDCDKIVGNVVVRSRQEGDRITLAGRNCSKSLKKLFNELHIPPEERRRIPVITDNCGIIGIGGYAAAERVAVDSNTSNVLTLYIRTEDKL